MEKGILYVATGEKYVQEALRSVGMLRRHLPNIPTCIFTDRPGECHGHFSQVKEISVELRSTGNKIAPLRQTPFEKTLFMDTDVWILEDISTVFDVLNDYHVAAAHAMTRDRPEYPTTCPDWFPELNSGFILYRSTEEVHKFLESWEATYLEFKSLKPGQPVLDQPSFRQSLFNSGLPVWVLPPEYNFRTHVPNFSAAGARVKAIHGRQDLSRLQMILNQREMGRRIYTPSLFRRYAPCVRVLSERDELLWRISRRISRSKLYRWFARVVLSRKLPFRRLFFEAPIPDQS